MSSLAERHLETALEDLRDALEEGGDGLAEITPRFERLKESFDRETVGFCLDMYITSELDARTPGPRGLGRTTDHPPRLAACYRKQFWGLDEEAISELYELLQASLLAGYLTCALLTERPLRARMGKDVMSVYKEWVPSLYAAAPPEQATGLLDRTGDRPSRRLKMCLERHGMSVDGMLVKDKIDEILSYYPQAGWKLRAIETRV